MTSSQSRFAKTLSLTILRGGEKALSNDSLSKPSPSASQAPHLLSADIDKPLLHHSLTLLLDQPPSKHLSLPLNLVPKDDGGFRGIHDLSYPRGHSISDYLSHELGSLKYVTFDDAINAVKRIGCGTTLIKKDCRTPFVIYLRQFQTRGYQASRGEMIFGRNKSSHSAYETLHPSLI